MLFHRDNRRVTLTAAGETFRRYAEDAEQRWQQLQRELASDTLLHGKLTLYCSVTAASSFLPSILGAFRAHYPGVQIKLQTGDAAEALARLRSGEAEITIAALPERLPATVNFLQLGETPLVFIEPVTFPQTLIRRGNAIDWQATPMIVPERGPSRTRLDRWFRDHNLHMNIYAQVAGNEALLTMVSLGCGVGVIPKLVLDKSTLHDQVHILETAPTLSPFIIGACTLKKHMQNPLVEALWAIIEQQTGKTRGRRD